MPRQITRGLFACTALALVFASTVSAQSTTSTRNPTAGANMPSQFAELFNPTDGKLIVVTVDKPDRRQSCHVQSFTKDELVCARTIGGARTYTPQQVVALLLPGDDQLRAEVLLGLNAGLGAAIWGTVVLAAACPACAVGTGIAALIFFAFAGAVGMTDDVPDHLLYLAPGQELSGKLGYIQK